MKEKNLMDLIKEMESGYVEIKTLDPSPWKFYTKYNAIEEDSKDKSFSIHIPNFDNFYKAINDYLQVAKNFYCNDKNYYAVDDESFEKLLIFYLILNINTSNLNNVIGFVKLKTDILKSEIDAEETKIGELFGGDIFMKVSKNRLNYEGPYTCEFYAKKDKDYYNFPEIVFGIGQDGKTVYVYAVQNKHAKDKDGNFVNQKYNNDLAKKFTKSVYKFNKDVDEDSIEANVSPNALAVLTLFLSQMKQKGINKCIAYDFLPLRYDAGVSAKLSNSDKQEHMDCFEKFDKIEFNVVNKFMYLFLRYIKHFSDSEISYNELEFCIELLLKEQTHKDGNLIYQFDELSQSEKNNNKNL